MDKKIEIPLSKLKIGLLFSACMVFIILGILWTISPENSSLFIRIFGIISTIFFGICGLSIGKKLFDRNVGLIIDDNGIIDNTNATSIGLIEWDDITGIERVEIASTKILVIKTDKPNKYIERAKNELAKRAMKVNNKMYGSPLSIISNSLKIKFNKLENLIINELENRKK